MSSDFEHRNFLLLSAEIEVKFKHHKNYLSLIDGNVYSNTWREQHAFRINMLNISSTKTCKVNVAHIHVRKMH